GGAGRQVLPLGREQLLLNDPPSDSLVFIDDRAETKTLNGHQVLTFEQFLAHQAVKKQIAIAIADGHTRAKLATQLEQQKIMPWTIKATNAVIMDEVDLGPGAILSAFVVLTSNIKIGRYFYANHYSHVAHDCIIGDFVTLAPGARCNGNVIIKDHAYIGTGAMLRQGTPDKPLIIGENAVVGMGAVVTKDVPPNTTVVGNPARPLHKP